MKRIFGIALMFVLGAGVAQGGGIGGLGGGLSFTIIYDSSSHSIRVPGRLDERFEVSRRGVSADSGTLSYYMEPSDFALLQQAIDSRQVINAKGENGTRSYRAVSGDQPQQVEMIDRRAAARYEVQ